MAPPNFLLFTFLMNVAFANEIVLSTKLGRIKGNKVHRDGYEVNEFLGIKYGLPPINELRFKPSQINTNWSNEIYNAQQYGPACLQMPSQPDISEISEDCLYLNIWTPSNVTKQSNLPVMFWIHGGGFLVGSGSQLIFHGDNFVGSSNGGDDFIYVSINYRLGAFGWLSSPQIYDDNDLKQTYGGMNGVYDQITAIKWVKQYISSFGGNPHNITIFGQSAGGMSLCMLLISPLKELTDLFQRFIIESGSCNGIWGQPSTLDLGLNFSKTMIINAGYPNNITYLRTIENGTDLFYNLMTSNATGFSIWWKPSVDMFVMDDLPRNIYSNEVTETTLNSKTGIIGVTSLDAGGYYIYGPNTTVQYKQLLSLYLNNDTQINLMYNFYYPISMFPPYINISNVSYAWSTIIADTCTICPSMYLCDNIVNNGSAKCWYYIFAGTEYPYAPHASELPFVFDHQNETQGNTNYYVSWNQTVSNIMLNAWTNFGKYGIPNVDTNDVNLEWMSFNNKQNGMIFSDYYENISDLPQNYRNGVCGFYLNEIGWDTIDSFCKNNKRLSY